jgi:hypothetical protein
LEFVDHLDGKLAAHVREVECSEAYRVFLDPQSSTPRLLGLMRNILLEVSSYGPFVIGATCTAIGRLADRPGLIPPLMGQLLEEVSHPTMAFKGYVRLGGDEPGARSRRPSPAAVAVGAVCHLLARDESPFSYLGYMYLLESSTAILAARFQEVLQRRQTQVQFIALHATEDIEHVGLLRNQIARIIGDHPPAAEAIDHGFDCFAAVYPLPVWATALRRADEEAGTAACA